MGEIDLLKKYRLRDMSVNDFIKLGKLHERLSLIGVKVNAVGDLKCVIYDDNVSIVVSNPECESYVTDVNDTFRIPIRSFHDQLEYKYYFICPIEHEFEVRDLIHNFSEIRDERISVYVTQAGVLRSLLNEVEEKIHEIRCGDCYE